MQATAKLSLRDMFPNATEEQLKALAAGKPVPPSPDWSGGHPCPPGLTGMPGSSGLSGIRDSRPPLVSVVMVFGDATRLRTAQRTVQCFVEQTYVRRQMVIINGTDKPVTNVAWDKIKELPVAKEDLSSLRNIGLTNADGEWIMPWDDDDWHHPERIAFQMAHRREGMACLLEGQLRCHVWRSTAFVHREPDGVPGTILFPRGPARYPVGIELGGDREFFMANWRGNSVVIPAEAGTSSTFQHIALHHDRNLISATDFLGLLANEEYKNRWIVTEKERAYLQSVLTLKGFGVEARPADVPAALGTV